MGLYLLHGVVNAASREGVQYLVTAGAPPAAFLLRVLLAVSQRGTAFRHRLAYLLLQSLGNIAKPRQPRTLMPRYLAARIAANRLSGGAKTISPGHPYPGAPAAVPLPLAGPPGSMPPLPAGPHPKLLMGLSGSLP